LIIIFLLVVLVVADELPFLPIGGSSQSSMNLVRTARQSIPESRIGLRSNSARSDVDVRSPSTNAAAVGSSTNFLRDDVVSKWRQYAVRIAVDWTGDNCRSSALPEDDGDDNSQNQNDAATADTTLEAEPSETGSSLLLLLDDGNKGIVAAMVQ